MPRFGEWLSPFCPGKPDLDMISAGNVANSALKLCPKRINRRNPNPADTIARIKNLADTEVVRSLLIGNDAGDCHCELTWRARTPTARHFHRSGYVPSHTSAIALSSPKPKIAKVKIGNWKPYLSHAAGGRSPHLLVAAAIQTKADISRRHGVGATGFNGLLFGLRDIHSIAPIPAVSKEACTVRSQSRR